MHSPSDSRKHTSILTYAFLVLTLLFASPLLGFSPVLATCNIQVQCTPGSLPCQTQQNTYCCTGSNSNAECAALKVSEGAPPAQSGMTVDPTAGCDPSAINTALGCLPTDSEGLTITIFRLLAGLAGAIALTLMLMGTIQIMTAGGNAEQVKKGRELFTGAVVGLLFIIFSVALLRIIAGDIIQIPGFT